VTAEDTETIIATISNLSSGVLGTDNATHNYTTADTYVVKISGTFPQIYFNNTGDKDKIKTIENWGIIAWESFAEAFIGCSNLVINASDNPDPIKCY